MNVLIAEDDPTSRKVLQSFLAKWGFNVTCTADGEEAWQAFQSPEAPKLAVLDWMMPRLDGIELLRRLRGDEKTVSTYVLLLTAKGAAEDVLHGFEAGADDYIVKPFNRDELRVRINVGARIVDLQSKLRDRVAELEDALSRVKTLSGLLPICAYCKRIRDDSDYWTEVESYLQRFSTAEFSHGVCPSCYDEHMKPKMDEFRREREKAGETPESANRAQIR